MATLLLTLPFKQKRDLIRLRQLTRHAVDLLGFGTADQICITAAVFDLACQTFAAAGRGNASLEIVEEELHVTCTAAAKPRRRKTAKVKNAFRLNKALPATAAVPRSDVPWMLQQLAEIAPLDLFDEMRKINQDLLQVLLESARHKEAKPRQSGINAA